jgi:ketosteroid isomerase-like protein
MRLTAAVFAIVALVAGCSTPAAEGPAEIPTTTALATSTSTSEPALSGPEWAMPGLEFMNALGSAVRGSDAEAALAFYHPDARLFAADAGGAAIGWRQISEVLENVNHSPDGLDVVLIGDGLGAVMYPAADDCGDAACPGPGMDVFWIWDGAIGVQLHSSEAELSADDPLLELYVGSAEAYSAHDIEGMRSFYSDAVFAPPFPLEEYETLFATFPELAATPLTLSDLGLGDADRPALFDLGTTGASSNRARAAVGVYEVTFAPEVRTIAASLWRLWDGRIVEAATMFDADGWDRMLEFAGLEPPPSWFTSIETPEPRVVERTHVVDVGDGTTIELFDATDAVADLVEWSLERYAAAGLGPPHVDAVYLETERTCLQESAWTHLNSDSAIIRFCLDADDIGNGDGLAGEFTMLHELAHVWTAEYLSEAEKETFTSERGLATWNDASAAWSDRGNEHASEIMAWGLAREPIDLVRLGSPNCEELAESFRSLTGSEPLHGC